MKNEKRLIDANALLKKLYADFEKVFRNAGEKVKPEDYYIERRSVYEADLFKAELDGFAAMVNALPTVDAVEVVHGRWIAVPSSDMMTGKAFKCSKCNKMRYGSFMPNYCQICGAKMDSDRNE